MGFNFQSYEITNKLPYVLSTLSRYYCLYNIHTYILKSEEHDIYCRHFLPTTSTFRPIFKLSWINCRAARNVDMENRCSFVRAHERTKTIPLSSTLYVAAAPVLLHGKSRRPTHEEKRLPHGMHRAKEKKKCFFLPPPARPPACQTDRQMCKATPSYSSCLYFILGQCIGRRINPAAAMYFFNYLQNSKLTNFKSTVTIFETQFGG